MLILETSVTQTLLIGFIKFIGLALIYINPSLPQINSLYLIDIIFLTFKSPHLDLPF